MQSLQTERNGEMAEFHFFSKLLEWIGFNSFVHHRPKRLKEADDSSSIGFRNIEDVDKVQVCLQMSLVKTSKKKPNCYKMLHQCNSSFFLLNCQWIGIWIMEDVDNVEVEFELNNQWTSQVKAYKNQTRNALPTQLISLQNC